MSRLTKKHRFLELYIAKENVPQHIAFDKLGELEDLMEEYNINSVEELKEIIKKGLAITQFLESEWKVVKK